MNKNNSGSVLIWIIAGSLLIFTAFRSVHLVTSTLPSDAAILGFAALFALDLGVLAWMFYATRGARGAQRTVAILMIMVDLAGVSAAVIGDTLLVANPDESRELITTVATWIIPIVIMLNVGAVVAVHVLDPAQGVRDAKRALSDELEWQLTEHLRGSAAQVAAGAVPAAVKHQQAEMIAAFMASAMGVKPKTAPNGQQTMTEKNTDGVEPPSPTQPPPRKR